MKFALVVAIILGVATVAGIIGWRRATKPIYRRSIYDEDPPEGMSRRDFDRLTRRRRKTRRLVITILYAARGAALAFVLLMWSTRP